MTTRFDDLRRHIAEQHGVDDRLLADLIAYEHQRAHLLKRRGAVDDIRRMIEKHGEEGRA